MSRLTNAFQTIAGVGILGLNMYALGFDQWFTAAALWIGGIITAMGALGFQLESLQRQVSEMSHRVFAADIVSVGLAETVTAHDLEEEAQRHIEATVQRVNEEIEWHQHDPIATRVLARDGDATDGEHP